MHADTPPSSSSRQHRINLGAPILGWLLPGLGHWSLGYRRRGVLIAVGVLSIYVLGLLIGGLYVIDSKNARWWFYGQCLSGPATPIIQYWRSAGHEPPAIPPETDLPPGHGDTPGDAGSAQTTLTPSFSHINEVGTLYTTIAGMLNLVALFDVMYLAPARKPIDRASAEGKRILREESKA
ncbi:MAG: hypothetical protein D8M59_05955 [Planctomycetes bacterium]|nr:hypothetical protein [Planctomycetota bacterium]NOG55872.1 hypothetical protein [Planctomycetota bacterium]